MDVFLETPRLILRRFTMDDLDDVFELDSDPEVMFFITGGRADAARGDRDRVPSALARLLRARRRPVRVLGDRPRDTGEFIGWFHLRPGEDDAPGDEPELGYRLRRDAWGKGYATEGARALVDKAFAEFGVDRVRRRDHGRQHGVAAGDGKGRPAVRQDVLRRTGRTRSRATSTATSSTR